MITGYLDKVGKCLFDVTFQDRLNPFYKAKCALAEIEHGGSTGALEPLFHILGRDCHAQLLQSSTNMTSGFAAQISWRFLEYDNFPFSWAAWVHPGRTEGEQDETLDAFFDDLEECCLKREFDLKVRNYFGADKSRCKNSSEWRTAVLLFALHHCFTDMSMERLLGLFRHWCPSNHTDAERLVATGLLGQSLTVHKASGGDDPRAPSRKQMLDDGVPLRCKKGKKGRSEQQPAGAFVHWMRKQEKARETKLEKAAYRQWQRERVSEWNGLSDARREAERLEALVAFQKLRAEQVDDAHGQHEDAIERARSKVVRTVIDDIGDRRTPFAVPAFDKVVKRVVGMDESERSAMPGLTGYAETLRERQLGRVFIESSGASIANLQEYSSNPQERLRVSSRAFCSPSVNS